MISYSLQSLRPRAITERGVYFATGVPVNFLAIHNTAKAHRPSNGAADRFQQKIEPAGMYLLHSDSVREIPPGWIEFPVSFQSPLVITFSNTGRYDETSWKAVLRKEFKATGIRLTKKLLSVGYDGVVTVESPITTRAMHRDGYVTEIVDLRLTDWEIK